MPIFGYNVVGVGGSLGLGDTSMYGNWNVPRVALRGSPVLGGNLVSAHVYMTEVPFGGVAATAQIAVYDATPPVVPANWPLFATSAPFNVPVGGALPYWFVTPIAGVLVAGNSYAAAVLANNADVSNPSVWFDVIGNEYAAQNFIAPGVFPNPLGVGANMTREWSLYVYYELPGDGDGTPTAACCCMPHGNSNM